ncbi:mechanosensitive ion channel family protein [Oceanicoccus sp. KOV_DT_Chl]|uniref:mechanosensitive ion channel family protein n=1 Tax=Oceanicoccus sp. KOV_DT_Chl TaxID=1904639 RepID=UPI000C7B56B0|nr:mechanosensitive ion channel family protein [Oceanicoccus sp. KOV_DT_Chl]
MPYRIVHFKFFYSLFYLLIATFFSANALCYEATTTGDATIATEDLELLVLPLSISELEIEANAWQQLLKQHVTKISQEQILANKLGRSASKLDKSLNSKDPVAQQNLTETLDLTNNKKEQLAGEITQGGLEQSAIINRLNIVLAAWEKKGGDPSELRLYADAVSGVKVDISNSSTAMLAITSWMRSEEGGVLLLENFIKFFVAMVFVILLANLATKLADRISTSSKVSVLLESFIKVAARRTVLIIGTIMSLTLLDVDIGPMLALIGAAGLVVGLALQGTLSNFASGVLILIYRPYDVSDVIKVGSVTGQVDSMTLLSTTIKTLDNQLIMIPNNSVWGDAITNITGSSQRRIDMIFGIAYNEDFAVAKNILLNILNDHPMVLDEPEARVRVHELADSSVNLICRPWVKTEDYWDVYWDVTETVKREFDAQGISIPFPQRDVHLFTAGELAIKSSST